MTNLYPIIFLLFFPVSCMMGIGDIVLLRKKKKAKSLYIYIYDDFKTFGKQFTLKKMWLSTINSTSKRCVFMVRSWL